MKKHTKIVSAMIVSAMLLTSVTTVMANEIVSIEPISTTTNTKVETNDTTIVKTIINGKTVEIPSYRIFEENKNTMVPLRILGEALGFTITWNEEDQTVNLDDGMVKTTLKIGEDQYYKASSKALGLTNRFQYGSAPVLVDDTTYVPVQLFQLLYSNPSSMKVEDSTMYIIKK